MGITVARTPSKLPSATLAAVSAAPVVSKPVTSDGVVVSSTALPKTGHEQLRRWISSADVATVGAFSGATARAVGATVLGATSLIGGVAHAQDTTVVAPLPVGSTVDTELARAAARIEARRDTMTATELAAARRELYSAYVDSTAPRAADAPKTRGEVRVDRLLRELERRMEVTAYDLAHPGSYTTLEGHVGYKTIPEDQVVDLLRDAVQDIPVGELPGGKAFATFVRGLPNAGHLDAENMSFRELKSAVGSANREALRERFQPLLDQHKTKIAVGGFLAVTAVRASSPEAARLLDRITPRIEVWDHTSSDGRLRGDASLRYRDGRVLPDVDVRASATHRVGVVDLRATSTASVALTGERPLTGALGVGARITGDTGWLDLEGNVDHTRRSTLRLSGVLDAPDAGLVGRGSITGTFGEGVARGDARGRVDLEASLDKRLDLGRNVDASVGLYGAVSADTDGRNEDARFGLMFRMRW